MKFKKTVVDGHFHLYNVYDAYGKDFLSAVDEMQSKHNLKAINIASIPTHQRYGVDQNIICALYKLHNKTAYAYGGIAYPEPPVEFPLPDGMDSLTQYKELMEIGFDGIKFLESKPAEQKEYGVCIFVAKARAHNDMAKIIETHRLFIRCIGNLLDIVRLEMVTMKKWQKLHCRRTSSLIIVACNQSCKPIEQLRLALSKEV